MPKNVLVLYYTQSGQMEDILRHFLLPFSGADTTVEMLRIKPAADFPFPWTSERFFDAMPETVLGVPVALQPFQLKQTKYDLVVLAYQPWFLSVSLPIQSALLQPQIQQVLKDTPVVTLIAARNMWINAQEKLKGVLKSAGAKLAGNIVLVDKAPNLVSVITILYWMMTAKKDSYLGIFPKPGVSDADMAGTDKYGRLVFNALQSGNWATLQAQLVNEGAVEVLSNLMFIEERAPRLFSIWANIIVKRKNRKAWLVAFKYYLLFALFIIAPIVLTINFLFFRVFFLRKISTKKAYYAGVDLKTS